MKFYKMRNTKIITGNAYLTDQKKQNFFSKEELNNSFSKASNAYLKNILNVTKEKLVSIDFNHNSASAILDSSLTNFVGSQMGKISAWYDNVCGFSNRICDIASYLSILN